MGDYSDDFPVERHRNDPKTSREKPDLVGPVGGYFPAWNKTKEYDPNSGTSFATPFVVGTEALLMANFGHEVADNNSFVDNTEMIEFTSATRSSFSLKVHEARWDQCSNGSKSTHFVIA